MYHRFEENKYPSTNIRINDFLKHLEVIKRNKIQFVNPKKFEEELIGTEQELYLNKAIFLLESFRNNKLKPNEVFDTNQLATLMALRAIFGSAEFDTNDLKFYYNPIDKKKLQLQKHSYLLHFSQIR